MIDHCGERLNQSSIEIGIGISALESQFPGWRSGIMDGGILDESMEGRIRTEKPTK